MAVRPLGRLQTAMFVVLVVFLVVSQDYKQPPPRRPQGLQTALFVVL